MKVGDFVGITDTWDDEHGYEMLGIVIELGFNNDRNYHIVYTIHGKKEYWNHELLEVIF
jgi:hypothetical protein